MPVVLTVSLIGHLVEAGLHFLEKLRLGRSFKENDFQEKTLANSGTASVRAFYIYRTKSMLTLPIQFQCRHESVHLNAFYIIDDRKFLHSEIIVNIKI